MVVRSELGLQIVRLRDVSRTSARIVHDGRFLPGMTVKLQLAPGVRRLCHDWHDDSPQPILPPICKGSGPT